MILDAVHRIANHSQSLDRAEAREVMSEVLAGKCTDAQIAALLIALRMKGETVEEIVGFAEAIRAAAAPLPIERARHSKSATKESVANESSTEAIAVSGTGRDALLEESAAD